MIYYIISLYTRATRISWNSIAVQGGKDIGNNARKSPTIYISILKNWQHNTNGLKDISTQCAVNMIGQQYHMEGTIYPREIISLAYQALLLV